MVSSAVSFPLRITQAFAGLHRAASYVSMHKRWLSRHEELAADEYDVDDEDS
jgi:hypothetical protein